jgi:phytanoyl-CoA hydroxylase
MNTKLSDREIAQFKEDGYLVFKGLLDSAACDAMLAVTKDHLQRAVPPVEYEAELGYPGAPASLDAPGGKTIRRLRNAHARHDCFRSWAEDKRVVTKLAQLFNEPVCLSLAHHNCVMTKHPAYGTATGWHRDIRYWSFQRADLISVWLALGTETASNGALHVIPGSHRWQMQPGQMDELDFLRPDVEQNQPLFAQGKPVELQKGDVLFFHSGVFHSAQVNTSDQVKFSTVFAYHGQSNAPLPGTKSAEAGDILVGT